MTAEPSMALLSIRDLKVDFLAAEGLVRAVRGVSFDVPAGKTVALVGESGSGKTVLSQAVLGILPRIASITGGQMLFRDPKRPGDEVDLAALGEDHPTRRSIRGDRISIIFQEPMSSLSPLHTIGDQIGEALLLHADVDQETARRRTIDMLDRVGFPKPDRAYRTYPFELSGGLRQRAMIAMALVCDPALLIADEPTTALDVTIQAQTLQLMQELQKEFHMAILFITHDLGVVANMADEVVVLYRGRVMESGRSADLLSAPEHPYLKALMHAVPTLSMSADERLTPLREVKTSARTLLGAGLRPDAGRDARPSGEAPPPILEVDGLKKTFRIRKGGWLGRGVNEITAVDDVSFRIARGEAFGLVGESGCGKTTVSKLIMRAVRPDAGHILFNGRSGGQEAIDVLGLDASGLEAFRKRLQYVFQDPFHSLNPRMTVFDIVAEPLVIHDIGSPDRAQGDGQETAAGGRPGHSPSAPLPAQLFRRPAPAYRHRESTGARPGASDLRRAGVRARRFGAGADPEPAEGSAGRARPHLSLHFAQSGGGQISLPAHRRDVRRAHRRDGADRRAVRATAAPLHPGPAGRRARAGSRPAAGFRCPDGRQDLGSDPLALALHPRCRSDLPGRCR